MLIYYFLFFFSSRRRHTRLVSDWSSDVCSSDLKTEQRTIINNQRVHDFTSKHCMHCFSKRTSVEKQHHRKNRIIKLRLGRSEERRVGKECRSGRWTY